ncbi:MAG TPA: ABC transporter ATP-binding protein [Gemmatimonadaceae bacterium]|nr:ABC transporter ATP-binding protein [Gemmatimonadaceae bacterium]
MISVRNLTKLYGDFTAVRELSFEVAAGEVLGLVGPNGAGKTTTLRSISGIIPPSGGVITIAGHDMRTDAIAAKRALAFIPDEPHLFEYLSVEEHLRFIGRLYGVSDVETRMPTLLRELELSEKLRALPGELSRGMRQKLAIACGLLHDPSALILDEPLTGLDPGGMRRMRETIQTRAANGAAVILSSHLLNLVEELCDKLLVVRRGECVAFGTIDEIIATHQHLAGKSLEDVFLALTGDDAPPPPARTPP